jgi:hypothetical protein
MLIKSEQSYELWSCSKWKAQRWKSKPVKMKTVFQPNWANMSRCTPYIIHQHSRRKSATQFMQRPLASCPFVDFNSARRAVTFTARARGQIKTTKTASAHWLVFALQIGVSLYLVSLSHSVRRVLSLVRAKWLCSVLFLARPDKAISGRERERAGMTLQGHLICSKAPSLCFTSSATRMHVTNCTRALQCICKLYIIHVFGGCGGAAHLPQ